MIANDTSSVPYRCSNNGHCHKAYLGRIGLIVLRGLLTDEGLDAVKSSVFFDEEGVDVKKAVSVCTPIAFSGLETIKRAS